MKFRKWINENAWIDAAKEVMRYPSAMSDQDLMKQIGNLPQTKQIDLMAKIPYYAQNRQSQEQGMQLSVFGSFQQIHDVLSQIDDDVEDQMKKISDIRVGLKNYTPSDSEEEYDPDTSVLETINSTTAKTSIWQHNPENLSTRNTAIRPQVQKFQTTPSVPSATPKRPIFVLETTLIQTSRQNMNNQYEIRKIWEYLGWKKLKDQDTFNKTGLPVKENALGGDSNVYFPNGYPELELKINQATQQVQNVSTQIDSILRSMNKRRQYV